jgi:hypothetical protein
MIELVEWLSLVTTLPARNKAERMRLWRSLKMLGCATLRDGVYLLPANEAAQQALQALADEVRAAAGSAEVLHIAASGAQDATFCHLFDRSADYGRLVEALRSLPNGTEPRKLEALQREFATIAAIDFFPGAARMQAEATIAETAARLTGEPQAGTGNIRRLASADFSGRTWATRKHLWVDRMASAWLIRRFIDRKAKFLWLDKPADCPAAALGFDFDGADFTHVAATSTRPEYVSVEVLAVSFGLDADPALARITAIVHCLDVGGVPVPEATGIEAVLAGLRASTPDDDQRLIAASHIFDSLYQCFQQENPDD